MATHPLIRGKKFPSLVESVNGGYKLLMPVPAPGGYLIIQPPQSVVGHDTNNWPAESFQLLLVASEYCAALLEFMTWAFPEDWAPLKAQVAGYARQLIRTSAAVPRPDVQPGSLQSWLELNAHSVWVAFTYCYFHGLPSPEQPLPNGDGERPREWQNATRWLRQLVGETGWREDGPVYAAVQGWVEATLARLRRAYPDHTSRWLDTGEARRHGVAARMTACRGELKLDEDRRRYYPLYPLRVTGGYGRNRIKFKVGNKECKRSIAGSCGVPNGFTDTKNCALGFLVLSDIIEAYLEATEKILKGKADQTSVLQAFFDTVLYNDGAELRSDHLKYGYPPYLASCALGWRDALEQLPRWRAAAAASAAAAGWDTAADGLQIELVMPEEMSLLDLQTALQEVQQQQEQQESNLGPELEQALLNGVQGQWQQQLLSTCAKQRLLQQAQKPSPLQQQAQPSLTPQAQRQLPSQNQLWYQPDVRNMRDSPGTIVADGRRHSRANPMGAAQQPQQWQQPLETQLAALPFAAGFAAVASTGAVRSAAVDPSGTAAGGPQLRPPMVSSASVAYSSGISLCCDSFSGNCCPPALPLISPTQQHQHHQQHQQQSLQQQLLSPKQTMQPGSAPAGFLSDPVASVPRSLCGSAALALASPPAKGAGQHPQQRCLALGLPPNDASGLSLGVSSTTFTGKALRLSQGTASVPTPSASAAAAASAAAGLGVCDPVRAGTSGCNMGSGDGGVSSGGSGGSGTIHLRMPALDNAGLFGVHAPQCPGGPQPQPLQPLQLQQQLQQQRQQQLQQQRQQQLQQQQQQQQQAQQQVQMQAQMPPPLQQQRAQQAQLEPLQLDFLTVPQVGLPAASRIITTMIERGPR